MAAVGYDWIHRLQRVFAYLMLALLGVFTLGALFLIPVAPVTADALDNSRRFRSWWHSLPPPPTSSAGRYTSATTRVTCPPTWA